MDVIVHGPSNLVAQAATIVRFVGLDEVEGVDDEVDDVEGVDHE